jgi:acyl-CoA dehydrogenase
VTTEDTLTDDELRGAVRDLAGRFDDAYWARLDEAAEFPWEFYEAFASAGWLGIAIPQKYGAPGWASPRPRRCCTRSPRPGRG